MPGHGVHHVVYATRDIEATRHFYEDLMGFEFTYAEVNDRDGSVVKHIFFDAGDGASLAFFEVKNVGERPDYATDVSDSVGLPFWVNHCAFRSTEEHQAEVVARMKAESIEPVMDLDHGWCHSVYFIDPSGVMVELCRDTPGFTADREAAMATIAEAAE